jgi:nucleoid DNA-binding protein
MARELTYKTLCENLATKSYLSEKKVDTVLQNLVLLIASELQNNSYISIKNIGKFTTEIRGGQDEWFETGNGKMEKKYVEPFSYVDFTPSQNLLDVVNGESITFLFNKIKQKSDKPVAFEDLVEENIKEKVKTKAESSESYLNDISNYISKRKRRKEDGRATKPILYGDGKFQNLKEYNESNSRPILCINNNIIYPSINCASKNLGLTNSKLYRKLVLEGKDECDGYKFKFVEKEKGLIENGEM